jgi:TonB family protein
MADPGREDMQEKGLFSEAFLVHESLFKRLCYGTREAFNEFSNDPKQFLVDAIKGGGPGGPRRKTLLRLGLAIGLLFYAGVFLATVVLWSVAGPKPGAKDDWVKVWLPPTPGGARAPVAEGPKNDKKPSGGGGGGDNSDRPASAGQPPPYSLVAPIIAPTTRPQLNVPELPVPETLLVDPRLQPPRPDGVPTGMPNGAIGPPSDGPGSDHGVGTGREGGIGDGPGKGLGPGEGWNTGDPGKPGLGGIPSANERTRVDSPPVPLNRPRPNYTEAARKNRVQGLIRARVLVGADGSVQRVVVSRGLADGLDEEAIAAAYQMQFKPATKNGRSIACWVTVEIEFNLR